MSSLFAIPFQNFTITKNENDNETENQYHVRYVTWKAHTRELTDYHGSLVPVKCYFILRMRLNIISIFLEIPNSYKIRKSIPKLG